MQPWVSRLWEEKPARYSRALLETLALIAYRQPITRGDIEDVRGVTVSTSIMKTLLEREWIRIVGHREVPGRPAMYGTTKQFLDYFNLKNLDELPTLAELRDLGSFNPELQLDLPDSVVDNRMMPANDEPDATLHAQEETATIDESSEDASASLH
jgi:segregation and condensation protein B